ncbi:MAG: hypothetical protein HYY78_12110 [Betaproteobacteria bacterium]|nr:hypothetical protein [Betaproteobacteria bacterium]
MSPTAIRPSDATVRALKRVEAGEQPTLAAAAERIHPSTLFRQLAKQREHRLFLIIAKENGGYNAWIENERYKQQGQDTQYGTVAELQAALPSLLAKV